MGTSSFRELRVWQEAMKLTTEIYKSTGNFPRHELYGLSQQVRRQRFLSPAILPRAKAIVPIRTSFDSCFMRADHSWSYKPS